MAISYNTGYRSIVANGEDPDNPLTFKDIIEYFQDNPIDELIQPQTYGSDPYELCEGNASEWSGQNGFGTPVNDSVIYDKNSQSIKIPVSSPPSTYVSTISAIYLDGITVRINCSNATQFSVNDEIEIKGTTNWNFKTYVYFVSSSYILVHTMKGFSSVEDWPAEYTGEIWQPLTAVWNDGLTHSNVCVTDVPKVKFSVRSDGAGTPKLTALKLRTANNYNGASIDLDVSLSTTWQEIEVNIRDMYDVWWVPYSAYRGYWHSLAKVFFSFEGLSAGENVWIDGLRFTQDEPNPYIGYDDEYHFNTGLRITGYFKDSGFNVNLNLLESYVGSYSGLYVSATSQGDILFGDYDLDAIGEGGIFRFNSKPIEGIGDLYFHYVECHCVTFTAPKYKYGVGAAEVCSGNYFRNCHFISNLNFSSSSGNTFENCVWVGGRYFMLFPGSGNVIEGLRVYMTNSRCFFVRTIIGSDNVIFKGVKIIDTSSKEVIYTDRYSAYTAGYDFINFDVSEAGDNPYIRQRLPGGNNSPPIRIGFSVSLKIVDENDDGIDSARIIVTDKDENILIDKYSDGEGDVEEFNVIMMEVDVNTTVDNVYYTFIDTDEDWIKYYPLSLTISKEGYLLYQAKLLSEYDKDYDIVKNGASYKIALIAESEDVNPVGFTNDAETEVVRHLFLNEDIPYIGDAAGLLASSADGNFYAALFTLSPGEEGSIANEAAYAGYARVPVPRGPTGWDEYMGKIRNLNQINFPECTGDPETLTYCAIMKEPTGDKMVCYGELNEPMDVDVEGQPQFGPYSLQFKLN